MAGVRIRVSEKAKALFEAKASARGVTLQEYLDVLAEGRDLPLKEEGPLWATEAALEALKKALDVRLEALEQKVYTKATEPRPALESTDVDEEDFDELDELLENDV